MWRGSREGSVIKCWDIQDFRGVEALSFCQVEISTILKLSLTHNSYHNS